MTEVAAGRTTRSPARARRRRILVVDDAEGIRTYLANFLELKGYAVDTAEDGRRALALLQGGAAPDVILLDIMMPGMNGMEVLATLRRDPRAQTIPVIMITAKGQDSTLLESYQSGADYFIPKPFTPRQLLHGLGLVLGMQLLTR